MDINIEKGSLKYLNECKDAFLNSELGTTYFSREGSARDAILEGLEQGNLFIALTHNYCVGFILLAKRRFP